MILSANKDIRSISDIYIYIYTYIYIYIYIIYMSVCVCVFIYVYITPPDHLRMFLRRPWPLSSSIAGLLCLQWHWLQSAKLQRDDLEHCWQLLQETRRGHSKTGNVPKTTRFKEKKAHKSWEHVKNIEGRLLHYALSGIFGYLYSNSRTCKSWMYCGECGRWIHHAYAGYERGGLCARFASTIMWHRIALWGGPLWPPCFKK